MVSKISSGAEDIFLKLVLLLPDQLIPAKIMEKYIEKRIRELEQEKIKMNWKKVNLEKATREMENR